MHLRFRHRGPLRGRRGTTPGTGPGAAAAVEAGRRPAVAIVGSASPFTSRLHRLARQCGYRVSSAAVGDGSPPVLPEGTTVVVVAPDEGDTATLLDLVPWLHRAHPLVRLVVAARGTDGFEAVFELGADVFIDQRADDDTVIAAIAGPGWRHAH
ncbi:hypothetical protein [Egicoccus sp. AB-alg2]|uniref:hypothetical protein n=1 Tax=Egicoccus sp. AB-alg2 TaxID=3242693 RepID=UPI00359EC000